MKRAKFTMMAALFAALLVCGSVVWAQDAPPPPPDGGGAAQGQMGPGRRGMDPEKRLEHMTRRYQLTADQQAQIKPLLADEQQQMQALRADASGNRADRFAKMKSIREETNTKIEAVLNEKQKSAFERDQARMQERMRHPPDGEGPPPPPDGGGAPPPPPGA